MNIYDTSVAFISAHLAANREKVLHPSYILTDVASDDWVCCITYLCQLLERNNDFHRIASHLIDSLGRSG